MKNILIGKFIESLKKSYDAGLCDDMSPEETDRLLEELSILKDKMENKQDAVMTIEEVSLYLNVSRQTVNTYVKEGKLSPKKHLGGVLEFKTRDVKKFLNELRLKHNV